MRLKAKPLHSSYAHPIKEVLPVTPLMITLLVVAGIALLIAIGYMNHCLLYTSDAADE